MAQNYKIFHYFFFLQPYFDKPIPDPTEAPTPGSTKGNSQGGYLYLKKAFYDVISNSAYPWQTLDICKSLQKLRLENTKVKGDGASVVLYCCPNVYSLGYLVFAAAGLKQVMILSTIVLVPTNITFVLFRFMAMKSLTKQGSRKFFTEVQVTKR